MRLLSVFTSIQRLSDMANNSPAGLKALVTRLYTARCGACPMVCRRTICPRRGGV